ncbi:MBL fold metallo-hydrolase [Pseudooceanicola sediminis]|uniref:MBL fold metallo-hydrolase n=1 Tax=Pseudooceanicola sediminis TaxID=2211117 RepID=A0A399J2E0_9RHOB|nr:MBL fold metallo-hydrolase [Pseudooceanicola sediminis]KAA2313810.1 MBL fold metallo-hydrolase [Puniceibacterium sp. HSS470]RII38629.1 MBL fold metallo-hydrolase [Pseudooceanicola sediminis]|tara:strand:- start:1228 stop:2277 length:1050 start_codon:yes stop_codon:yes gene_type:complete
MNTIAVPNGLDHPFPDAPTTGQAIRVAPGVLWMRLALPLSLDHVNIYAIEDGDGWFLWDAGMGDAPTLSTWETLLAGPLGGRPVTRLLVSHHHPDHVGAAGWLCARTGAELLMVKSEFLLTRVRLGGLFADTEGHDRDFYHARGLSDAATDGILGRGATYIETVAPLPAAYTSIRAGDVIRIGGQDWHLRTGGGHSDEMAMLWNPQGGVFLAADQVMEKITPNIGVWPQEPSARPLDEFLTSLTAIRDQIPDDALVLPGHKLPFRGLHRRVDELLAHHEKVCGKIMAASADGPSTVGALIPRLFRRELPPHHAGLAFAETLAHVNTLIARGALTHDADGDGKFWLRQVA